MTFIKKISSFFTRKPYIEQASVRLEKLAKWVDLQYKPLLGSIHTQLLSNVSSVKQLAQKMEKDNLALGTAPIYVDNPLNQSQIAEYKKQYVNAIHALITTIKDSDEDITSITIMYEELEKQLRSADVVLSRSQKRLSSIIPKQLAAMSENTNQLHILLAQAKDILEDPRNKSYVQIQRLILEIEDSSQELVESQAYIQKLESKLKEIKIEYDRYATKVSDIEHDPRYKLEKNALRSADTRFRHSFYELDLQTNAAKVEDFGRKIKALNSEIKKTQLKMQGLHITAKKSQILALIKRNLHVEVELVN